jgi:PAS domain S-box-containing protein
MATQELPAQSKQLFHYVFEQASLGIAVEDMEGKLLLANPALSTMLGYREDELCGMHCSQFASPEDSEDDWALFQQLRAGLIDCYSVEKRYLRKDGTRLWGRLNVSLLKKSHGGSPLVFAFVEDITERRRTEEALKDSEERLRVAVEAARMYAFDWDRETDVIVRSGDCNGIFNWSDNRNYDTGLKFFAIVHPDDREAYTTLENGIAPENPAYQIAYRILRPDGSIVWLHDVGQAYFDDHGKMLRMTGMVMDITERKREAEARRESEDKFRLLLDSTAEGIYGVDLEGCCTFCNPACLRALGYQRVDELLGKNMHRLIHYARADGSLSPLQECPIFGTIRSGEEVHGDNEVLWRANGTSFSAEYWSRPQRRGKEIIGAVVAFTDITERKLAGAALASVSRRLIEAQEQERTRIARDLHDDINQQLALLANEMEQFKQNVPSSSSEVAQRIGELSARTIAIAADVQFISHRLHSSKLEYLGLVAAIRSFCKEFGEQQKVKVDFQTHSLPSVLPPDISLCVFRVLQEALHNAAKHSGVKQFAARLWGTSDEIHLTVSDSGVGFDSKLAREGRGLGLISMEERLKFQNGSLAIVSQPERGATIHARVPIKGADSMRAAG